MAGAHDELGPGGDDGVAPPADPEAWTDAQWIAWLDATDRVGDGERRPPSRRRITGRRPASALGAAMVGLHEVLYGRTEEAAIVVECGGDPPRPDQPEVHLDPEHPERSTVVVHHRPHPG